MPSQLPSPSSRVKGPRSLSRSASSSSTSSSGSSASMYSSEFAQSSITASSSRPSGSRSSCSSENFYCYCGDYQCTLRRRAHIRRRNRHKPKVRPLPTLPRPSPRPLPRPVVVTIQERIRKLPVPPPSKVLFPTVSPTTCTTPAPLSFHEKMSSYDSAIFTPEIDWDAIMLELEVVHSGMDSGFSSDADSIYE